MTAREARGHGARHVLTRTVPGILTVALLAAPFVAAWQYDAHRRSVSAQAPAPAGGALPGVRPAAARHTAAPVVLAYHDVTPDSDSRYAVTPEQLDAHLGALRAAGYRALSSAEFTRYLTTGRAPAPRTVYLTFDDGTRGLWAYADPILAKHRMRAATYLITGMVGTRRPYYLTWAEIGRLAASGRWDFQAHTHDGHRRAAVDAAGRRGSVLANRLWLPEKERLETPGEYRDRVGRDLDRAARAFAAHSLPAPRLFAYPFSETGRASNLPGGGTPVLERLLRERFTATLTNTAARPLPAGARAAATGQVQRLGMVADTTPEALLREVRDRTSLAPGDAPEPLREPGHWTFPDGQRGALGAVTGLGSARRTYVSAAHRPFATADWGTYRVTARADGLGAAGTSVSVQVGYGSRHPGTLTVSGRGLRFVQRPDGGPPEVAVRELAPAVERELTLRVTPRSVRITVDGTTLDVARPEGVPVALMSGGIALGVRNEDPQRAWPRFTSLRISP
ncbi:polysaccharide deacetylase family protein [Streptomyces sp. NPDC057877]|uniref:polysaccharide deacetylase family protein n=1 Tax=Streptomyces sp. NPDC057877 TaxID=3346269 RepID=UPI0036B867E7